MKFNITVVTSRAQTLGDYEFDIPDVDYRHWRDRLFQFAINDMLVDKGADQIELPVTEKDETVQRRIQTAILAAGVPEEHVQDARDQIGDEILKEIDSYLREQLTMAFQKGFNPHTSLFR